MSRRSRRPSIQRSPCRHMRSASQVIRSPPDRSTRVSRWYALTRTGRSSAGTWSAPVWTAVLDGRRAAPLDLDLQHAIARIDVRPRAYFEPAAVVLQVLAVAQQVR